MIANNSHPIGISLRFLLCAAVLLLAACSPKVVLFTDLSQQEANEVYSLLIRAGFSVEKNPQKENGFTVEVPRSMAGEALDLLAAKGIPRDKKHSMAEIFPDDSMIASPLQEKARYLHGLSQELERTLMTVDGVIEARVHIVLPERTAGNDSLTPSSVAVFVKHNPDSPFQAYRGQIRNLVISSIPKMSESANDQNVSIVAIPASSRMEQPLALTWFGPLAIKSNDRFYLLGVIYLLILCWLFSLASMYLSCVEPARRPKVLRNFFAKSKEESVEPAVPENELGAIGKQ